jgi:ubiquinone/menaquinone biosynthesis C-methylase UbiE
MVRLNQFLIYDELPLWSAPFGLTLLDTIQLKKGINILDIGSGAGFPLLEIAERAGKTCKVYGIDPSIDSLEMISEKIRLKGISNAFPANGVAEELPFPDHFFGLIVANNGINNVQDERKVLAECFRVLSYEGQMVLTMNLPHTLTEFYEVFEQVLLEHGREEEVRKMRDHIHSKRKPVEYWRDIIEKAGFTIRSINIDGFKMRFADGTSFLEHYFIRTAFRKPWEEITADTEIFHEIENKLNNIASGRELAMSVPYACFDCGKPGIQ